MKTFICIVFLLGASICTTNSLQSTNDDLKNHAEHADKDPNSISYQSLSDNHVPTTVSNAVSTTLSNDSTSPNVNKQEDQSRGLSDVDEDSKNTVPLREKNTKSPDDSKTRGTEQETRAEPKSKQPDPSIDPQTEATDPKAEQEPDVIKGTEFPKSEHPGDENDNREVTTQIGNVTPTSGGTEQPEEEVAPEKEKTPPCSLLWPECLGNNSVSDVVKGLRTFTMDLYQKVSDQNPSPNLVVSPISVALALSQLLLGTNGRTKDVMLDVLLKGVEDTHCIHEVIQNLTTQDSFISASEIFYKKDLQIHKEFLDQSSRFYGSKGIPLPDDKTQSLEKINSWVSQRTKNLIPSILQELPPDLQLVLVNAIYYQGKWLTQFDPKLTRSENFNRLSLGSVKVPTMNAHKYPLQFTRDKYLQAQVARFPLSNNCSLLIFLPTGNADNSLETMRKRLNQAILNLVITQLEEVSVRPTSVSIPQLKLDTSLGLNDALSSLGLHDLFENPNLCALSSGTGLAVSDVNHRTFLEIKEEGVTAAAATSITIARTINVFTVKRPFLFVLVSDDTRVPLFIGHVSDPSQ